MGHLLLLVLLIGVLWAGEVYPKTEPSQAEIALFSPQGEAQDVRQVAVRFSRPMVPFGNPGPAEPFRIDCPATGQGRWVDERNWVYDFDQDLPGGLRCAFTLKPDLKTLAGETVKSHAPYTFSTPGPTVIESLPDRWEDVTEEQYFVLGFDTQVEQASLLDHLFCDIKGVGEKVGMRLVTGKERLDLLQEHPDFIKTYSGNMLGKGRERFYTEPLPENATPEEQLLAMAAWKNSPIVVAQCQRRLPNKAEVGVVVEEGLRSVTGVERGQPQHLPYTVRDAFSAQFYCQRSNAQAQCIPILPMSLSLTAPITRSDAQKIQLKGVDGTLYPASPDREDQTEQGDAISHLTFPGPFPEESRFVLEIPSGIQDDSGRVLANQDHFPRSIQTDRTPALAKFAADFGVVEWGPDATLPVTLRNLESFLPLDPAHPGSASAEEAAEKSASRLTTWWQQFRDRYWPEAVEVRGRRLRMTEPIAFLDWMKRVQDAKEEQGKWQDNQYIRTQHIGEKSVFESLKPEQSEALEIFSLPKPGGSRAFEVLGIPFQKPGLYVVELASDRLGRELHGEKKPYYVQTAVMVTNLAIHFKQGKESALVWVTALDQGRAVAGAEVTVSDCQGNRFAEGHTDEQGVLTIPKPLPSVHTLPDCHERFERAYLVTARSGEDVAFLNSSWNEGISPAYFDLPYSTQPKPDALLATVFDRTLLQAGDTLSMKHFARHGVSGGIVRQANTDLPKGGTIRHLGSGQEYPFLLEWNGSNSAESHWKIPKEAKSGLYSVVMTPSDEAQSEEMESGRFRVEVFRIPTMKAEILPVPGDEIGVTQVALDLRVSHLSGGHGGGMPVKLRGVLQPKEILFDDWNGFVFANGQVKAGVKERGSDGEGENKRSHTLPVQSLTLNPAGTLRAVMPDLPVGDRPQDLLAEMEYQDANGERLSVATHVTLWPSQVILGVKADGWTASQETIKLHVVALTPQGQPMAHVPVVVDMWEDKTFSHRKRLLGGFYAYEHHGEIKPLSRLCAGNTDAQGRFLCEGKAPISGNIILQAQAVDGAKRASYAHTSVWVTQDRQLWFEVGQHNRMDLLPEKSQYEPGEEAVLQVRMPFREATVLVTVEREGVLDHFVQTLKGENPTLRVPLRGHYAPNVFVSALAIRGRATEVAPTAMVDLGRPAFRLGYAPLKVGWQAHTLGVKVTTEQPVYKVRDRAITTIQVTTPTGQPLPEDAEVVLAAVDEGLLELKPNDSWNLLAAMMRARPLSVQTATAQEHLIGRRHYGRKAVTQGGGGGLSPGGRQLLQPLLLWQGRVKLDPQGQAQVAIPLNDLLTSFRVVAVASAGADLFGTGSTTFRTTQPLMIHAGLPPVVREQDRFQAGFTVRNGTTAPLQTTVTARVESLSQADEPLQPLPVSPSPIPLSLAPGESRLVTWDVTVPTDVLQLVWQIHATAEGVEDRLTVTQRVEPLFPVQLYQATLSALKKRQQIPIQQPVGAIPGRGGMRVQLQESLAGDLSSVKAYMAAYPYTCLEQRLSQSVVLQDEAAWQAMMAALPAYLDKEGLAKFFPQMAKGSETLTAYLLALADESGWEIPDELVDKMVDGLLHFVEGKNGHRSAMAVADLTVRKLAALEAIARYVTPFPLELLSSITVEPKLWPTSGVIDWLNLLHRVEMPNQEARYREAETVLRNRLHFQGTTLGFSTRSRDALWWLMVSEDGNAGRLLLNRLNHGRWEADIPRLAQGLLARQRRGHWDSTMANAWGMLAMNRLAERESTPVAGETVAQLATQEQRHDWNDAPEGGTLDFEWPTEQTTLSLDHQGSGTPWVTLQSRAAIPLKESLARGYAIRRTVTPVERKREGVWSQGDLFRVKLEVEAQTERNWVVIQDPIPAGATILGSGLGRSAQILGQEADASGWIKPAFEERTLDAFRAYYEWVPKGSWSVAYTVRLNNPGHFSLPPSRVEAMYTPDLFGEIPLEPLTVLP